MATRITNLISNGGFSTGSEGNWANWTSTGSFASDGGGAQAPTTTGDEATNLLSYTGLEGLNVGPGANGAAQLSLDIGWNDANSGTSGASTTMEIRVAGLLLATITSPAGGGTQASIVYSNGASGDLNFLTESTFGSWTLETLTIDLPASISATGSLDISVNAGGGSSTTADDFQIDNVSLSVTEVDLEAIDDGFTVAESEAGGDNDGNLLSNDDFVTAGVTEVNGATGGVASAVDGTNGGTFTIAADGTVDFDADGDFEGLGVNESAVTEVTYTLQSPVPFVAGSQSAQTSTEVGTANQQAFFTSTSNEVTSDGSGTVSATINLSAIVQPTYDILFVMDISGSTGFSTPLFDINGDGVADSNDPDLNGDGDGGEIIDAEIAALQLLSDNIDALGFDDTDLQIGVVVFDSSTSLFNGTDGAVTGILTDGGSDTFDAGSTALDSALAGVGTPVGGTDFELALDFAIDWFNAQAAGGNAADNNVIYFLSDGEHNGGTFTDEVATLVDPNGINAQISAVGITSNSNLTQLNLIDNTEGAGQTTGNSADQITDLAQLNAALQPPFLAANIVDLRVFVDGVQDLTIDENDLVVSGSGFELASTAISGLSSTPNTSSIVRFEVEFDDGVVMVNELVVDAVEEDTATVSVTVTGENDGPDAIDDLATISEDGPAASINLTGNDSDPDVNDDLSILSTGTTGTSGTVTVNSDGDSVTYDPNGQFEDLGVGETATDTFTYIVTDGNNGTDTATVTVTVNGVNDGPVAVDDLSTISEDGPAASINLTGNDSDPDVNDDLSILSTGTTGTSGTVTVNSDGDSVTYDPNGQFEDLGVGETATDTFTYIVTDGNNGTDTATVTVTVTGENDGPVAVDDLSTISEDGPAASINLTGNDSDPDVNDDLSILSTGTTGTSGTVTVNSDGDSVTYDPNGQFEDLGVGETATDTFTYVVTDGNNGTDTATVTVTVTGENDGPVAVDDTANSSDVSTTDIDLTGNDSDPDVNDDLEILSTNTTGTAGLVTVNSDGDSVNYDPNGAFVGLADGETALDTFTYVVTDGNNGTDTATVTVTITGGNEPPVAVDDTATVGEDDLTTTNIDLTGNDSDPDVTDDLSIASIDTAGTTGTVTVNSDGDSVDYDPNGQFEDLGVGETATDTFTYIVTDGNNGTDTATVTVTVSGANDGPVAVDDLSTISEDGPAASINLTGNDSDPDVNDDLSILSTGTTGTSGTVTVNSDGDSVTYDPNGQFEDLGVGETAIDTFTYVVTDGNTGTDTATVTVTVNGVNDGPVAVDDLSTISEDGPAASINLTGNDSDPDVNDDLSILSTGTTGTSGTVTVNSDGDSVTYDPNGQFEDLGVGETATDTFTYIVTDGNNGTDTATVTVTVTGENDGPVAVDDLSTISEDGPAASINLTGNDSDPDVNDDLSILSTGTTGTSGTVTVNSDGDSVTYDPNGQFENLGVGETATDTFTYIVTDGNTGTDTATVTVTVTGENDGPVAVDDQVGVASDATVNSILTQNDSDPDDNDDLEILSIDDTGLQGIVTLSSDGDTINYDPNGAFDALGQGDTAIETFTYVVTDGNLGTDTATVTVTIGGVNDPPVASDDITIGFQDQDVTFDVLTNDTDPNLDSLIVTDATLLTGGGLPSVGVVSFDPGGDITFDPAFAFSGLAEISYSISDGRGGTDDAVLRINVIPNAAPTIQEPVSFSILENTQLAAQLTGLDPEGDTLTWSIVGGPDALLFAVDSVSGELTFLAPPDFENPLDAGGDNRYDLVVQLDDPYNIDEVSQAILVTVTDDPETPPNSDPIARNDTRVAFQGSTATVVGLTANDSDPDLDTLDIISVVLDDPLSTDLITLNADDSITFTPDPATTGNITATYTVSDTNGGTDTATLTIIVVPNAAPTIQEPVSFAVLENQSLAANLQANDPEDDPLTWSISGGPDELLFSIDPVTGVLSFLSPPDFDTPLDQGADNQYNVSVTVADAFGSDSQDVLITVLDVDENLPPEITSPIAPPGFPPIFVLTALSTSENPVGTVVAVDPNANDVLEYQLFGEDTDLFMIDSASGEVSIIDPDPNDGVPVLAADLPTSFDGDRVYELDVLVIDGNGGSDTIAIELPLFLGG